LTERVNTKGTFDNEAALPRVPLPGIAATCARFIEWCAPLLDPDELTATEKATAAFEADPDVHELHAALALYDSSDGTRSWLDEFWRDRYLGRRDRIALNANFFFLFNDAADDDTNVPGDLATPQVARAAQLIASAARYKLAVDAEAVPPAVRRGQPLSMVQHRYLFGTTRIPGTVRDTVRAGAPPGTRHILVFVRGAMFLLDVLRPDGTVYPQSALVEALLALRAAAPRRGQGVGALTSKARAEWAGSRQALLAADPGNAAALDAVETALFCVALEDEPAAGAGEKCAALLAGDPGGRWFDKAVTLIVFPDGSAGINGEHCLLDGTTTVELIDTLVAGPRPEPETARDTAPAPAWRPLRFALTPALEADIAGAAAAFVKYGVDTAGLAVSYKHFSSTRAKGLGISPDAFVQLAYQLAHRRAKGFTGATYESISTRSFHYGRTEAMRVVTPEILSFVAAMDDPDKDQAVRAKALRVAAEAHVARARQCQAGDAPEQFLWELQLLARRRGLDWSPPLYDSPGWRKMRDDYLSTSAVPSVNVRYWGFGATSPHCIGVAYALLPTMFNVYLSTPRSVGAQMTVFADQLGAAISEMSDLLAGAGNWKVK
jgi:carnitine O-acetyltransferase